MHSYYWKMTGYLRRTGYLTPMQDLAYRRMIDRYYLDERPLQGDAQAVADVIGLGEELPSVKTVLRQFFTWVEGSGWHQADCDEAIAAYRVHAETARTNGKKGGRRPTKKTEPGPASAPARPDVGPSSPQAGTETGATANQDPKLNNKQETKGAPAPVGAPPLTPPPPPPRPPEPQSPVEAPKAADAPTPPASPPPPPPAPARAPRGRDLFKEQDGDRPKPKTADEFVLPDDIPANVWAEFLEHRAALEKVNKKAPFTAGAMRGVISDVRKCVAAGESAEDALRRCMAHGWRTPYPRDGGARFGGGPARISKRDADAAKGSALAGHGGPDETPKVKERNEARSDDFVDVDWRDVPRDPDPEAGQ